MISLWAFQDKLLKLGHFQAVCKNIEGLREHFGNQLNKLAANGFIRFEPQADAAGGNLTQTHSGPGDNVAGNQTKIGRQINMGPNSTYNENNS